MSAQSEVQRLLSAKSFSFSVPAGRYERFAPGAFRGLVRTLMPIDIGGGRKRKARVLAARVSDDGQRVELTVEWADADPCFRKIRFDGERAALDELARIIRRSAMGDRRRTRHAETGVYECASCAGWHLSSRPWGGNIRNRLEEVGS